jgi:predicted ribosomally synthesized peptide with SipW-like signal peptide
MKTRMIASFLVIALVAAVIGGASMAYFTAKAEAPENVFVAGTVMIDVGEEVVVPAEKIGIVNPGDCFCKCIPIHNSGNKTIELRLVDLEFDFSFNWDWICDHFEELCFSEDYSDCAELQAAVMAALFAGNVTNPAWAVGDPQPNKPFDDDGNLIIPVMAAPCPDSDWVMKYVNGSMEFYYAGGPIEPCTTVCFCVIVVFDGPWMGNLWQGATFTMGGGMFQAVQASNDAPEEVWGEGWDDFFGFSGCERLAAGTDPTYASYFCDNSDFLFEECCDLCCPCLRVE